MNGKQLVPNDRMCKYELDNNMQHVARPCKTAELLFNRQQNGERSSSCEYHISSQRKKRATMNGTKKNVSE